MKRNIIHSMLSLMLLVIALPQATAQTASGKGGHTLSMTVTDKDTKEAIIMATCVLNPLGATTVTNIDGQATMHNIPDGKYMLQVRYVGYEDYHTEVMMSDNLNLTVRLAPSNLSLKEVTVTAQRNASGTSTSSLIGRQAIDHLQAASLADIMQLIPGQLITNTDLTAQSNLQLRTLVNNKTSAFGSSIIVDGMPISNNGTLSQGGFSGTSFAGTDLRQIAADNIDNVEVIRGIPSAEYGDLTSGLVVVHSKVGVTPWQVKGKINPALQNYSVGKGFSLEKAGVLNFNFDYAKAWGDPRQKTRSFDRYTLNLGYGYDISRKWHTDTKFRFLHARDWNGKDPDAVQDGTFNKSLNYTFGLTHNGRISIDKPLMRTLSYTLGATLNKFDTRNASFVTVSSGLLPIITAMETGYYNVPWVTQSYLAEGITQSRPGNIYAKINDSFYLKAGPTHQSFKLGMDYHYDWNSGRGYYNGDESHPYRPNSDGRPRAFSDIPGLHQFAAYAEDNFLWHLNKVNRLRAQVGLRFTALQPFGELATYALSPRLNLSFSITDWMDIRGGIGLNSKTPGLDYLYPDRKYADRVATNYLSASDPATSILAYHTYVYDVKRSKDLKNATTTKIEAGIDFKLPGNRKLSILAYRDKTPNGFEAATEYTTYTANYYDAAHGLLITPGSATTINYADPARQDILFMTTGRIGNTNTTINKGIEFSFDLGKIKPISTSLDFSGAYSETKTYSTNMESRSVASALLPPGISSYGLTPFKVIYPSALDYNRYRRFVNTLRTVTHIPSLKMIATFTAQVIWQDYHLDYVANKNAIGWIDTNLQRHDITDDMLGGYLGMDGRYYATMQAGIPAVAISDLRVKASDAVPQKQKPTWNLSWRLTKELGRMGGLSLYVNNMLFYEPYLRANNNVTTLTQRNTNQFSYGVELYFNL